MGRPGAVARRPQSTEPLHQHRVVGQRLRTINESVQDLVVASGGEVEQLARGLFLGSGVFPPLPLKIEDRPLTLGEPARRRTVGGACGSCCVHVAHRKGAGNESDNRQAIGGQAPGTVGPGRLRAEDRNQRFRRRGQSAAG